MAYQKQNRRTQWNPIKIHFTDETYVSDADEVILELQDKNFTVGFGQDNRLTTSQLRNLLSLTSTIYTDVQVHEVTDIIDKIAYLRVQFVYQSGRNQAVKKFVELANILDILKQIQTKKDKESVLRFCRYMEALVAYFKFYGGRDQ